MTVSILDFFPRDMLKGVPKKHRTRSFRFKKKTLQGSISPKRTSKTENDIIGLGIYEKMKIKKMQIL